MILDTNPGTMRRVFLIRAPEMIQVEWYNSYIVMPEVLQELQCIPQRISRNLKYINSWKKKRSQHVEIRTRLSLIRFALIKKCFRIQSCFRIIEFINKWFNTGLTAHASLQILEEAFKEPTEPDYHWYHGNYWYVAAVTFPSNSCSSSNCPSHHFS